MTIAASPALPTEPPPARAPLRACIEGLILGHLPVLAAPWVMQYARHVAAEARGIVALLRVRSGEASVEIVAAGGSGSLPSLRARSLPEAIDAVRGIAAAWLVRVDELSEPFLAQAECLDAVTLLTGADEAATVAAYRAIKHLTPSDDRVRPEVQLALMGTRPVRAESALSRLARAAEAFLQRRVSVVACVERVSGGHSELVWSGPIQGPTEDAINLLCAAVRSTPGERPAIPLEPQVPKTAPVPAAKPTIAVSPPPEQPPPASRNGVPPAPAPVALPSHPPPAAPRPREALTRHFPDFFPISIRCPYAAGVELAIAPDGALHLLALDTAPAGSGALPGLVAVAAWVRDHLAILQPAAAAEGRRLAQGDPVMHLLTLDARAVRGLLDSGVKLHLLVIARAGEHTAWACAELN